MPRPGHGAPGRWSNWPARTSTAGNCPAPAVSTRRCTSPCPSPAPPARPSPPAAVGGSRDDQGCDPIIHWRHGGPTDLDNLVSLCRRHHTQLHDGTYAIRAGPGNTLTFTLPNGSHLISHLNPTPIITAHNILTRG